MITARLVGGLGNQLFIYSAARAVAERLNCPLMIDLSVLNRKTSDTPRSFALDWLVSEDQLLPPRIAGLGAQLGERLRRYIPIPLPDGIFRESGFGYDPRIEAVTPGTTLVGYFQSWRYFDSIEASLRSDLIQRSPISDWVRQESDALQKIEPWIAVHVRRGDYLRPSIASYHGILDSSYYARALACIPGASELPLIVFSDDPLLAQAVIEPLHPVARLVTPPPVASPMETLSLMSRGHALIMANSSFSWWAAWITAPQRPLTVAPAQWFTRQLKGEPFLHLPQWTLVSR